MMMMAYAGGRRELGREYSRKVTVKAVISRQLMLS